MIVREQLALTLPIPDRWLFDILTRYDLYSAWWPGILHSRVLVREGDVSLVEFRMPTLGRGRGVFEFFVAGPERISFEQVDQVAAGRLRGAWELRPTGPETTLLRAELGRRAAPWRWLERRRMRRALEAMAAGLEERCREPAGREGGRAALFEVREGPEGLEVLYSGRRYRAVPIREVG